MTAAQFRLLRACFEVCDLPTRRVRVRELSRYLGRHLNAIWIPLQALTELGLIRRETVGKKCVSGVYLLKCSFLLFRD